MIVIGDAKRNDIGSTAQAYADGFLGRVKMPDGKAVKSFDVDCLTVNAYLGSDGVMPFVEACKEHGKGVFILAKTSNPSSGDLQDRLIEVSDEERKELERLDIRIQGNATYMYNLMGLNINIWGQGVKGERGYSSIGAVVGATYPEQAKTLRKIMPDSFILVPGYGAQGGTADDVVPCFNNDGYGAIVNSSRGVIFAYNNKKKPEFNRPPEQFDNAARAAAIEMRQNICSSLKRADKLPAS